MSTYKEDGQPRTCRFHEDAMQYGYNARNLATESFTKNRSAILRDKAPSTNVPQGSTTKLQPRQQPAVQRYSKMSRLSNAFAEKNNVSIH